jgi:putative membrane protein
MTRTMTIGTAILLLAVAWLGPLPAASAHSFAAHMTLHMSLVAIVAPLLALGIAGAKVDPVRRAPRLMSPVPASLVELVVVWVWHTPALHHAARTSAVAFAAEQLIFLAAGLYFWLSVLGGDAVARRQRAGSGTLALVLTFAHMTLLGSVLALTPRALYHSIGGHGDALADQHLGGAIMLIVGALSYIPAGVWLTRNMLTAQEAS